MEFVDVFLYDAVAHCRIHDAVDFSDGNPHRWKRGYFDASAFEGFMTAETLIQIGCLSNEGGTAARAAALLPRPARPWNATAHDQCDLPTITTARLFALT